MSRYPRLAALRAQRQSAENEIAAPHKAVADAALQRAREERHAREGLERIMASKLAPRIIDEVGHMMGRGLYPEIMKSLRSIGAVTGTTVIEVPTDMLMAADPKSIVARVVDWWRSETAPRMSFRAVTGEMEITQNLTVFDVHVPEMRYRHAVSNLAL